MNKTRYFVVVSLLVLTVGLGTGLVAYYVGFQASAGQGPDELRYVPSDASLVAFADVRAVMVSEVRRKLLDVLPSRGQGRQAFEEQTGINVETDIDRVIACVVPPHASDRKPPVSGMVLARGRFNTTKIEALMREHGAAVQEYKGKRTIVADVNRGGGPNNVSVAFLEPGLVAVGSTEAVRMAVDVASGTGENVTANAQVMEFVKSFDGNAWAVGRFDELASRANLPPAVASQIPPITWFSASGRVDGGLKGALRADARDEESANSLRDVVRGVVALARLQSGAHPELQPMIDSIQLAGTGKTVTLSFEVSPAMFDTLATTVQGFGRGRGSR
jgi:hypothetical protein